MYGPVAVAVAVAVAGGLCFLRYVYYEYKKTRRLLARLTKIRPAILQRNYSVLRVRTPFQPFACCAQLGNLSRGPSLSVRVCFLF